MAVKRMPPPPPAAPVLDLPLSVLRFDPENPRLPSTVDSSDPSQVLRWMLEDASLLDLMASIASLGYFDGEPILVVKGDEAGSYIVVEGNRRLAATTLLRKPELAPTRKRSVEELSAEADFRPKELPALIYKKREDILQYLGYRHITGVKPWSPLAKSRYMRQLLKDMPGTEKKDQYRKLAEQTGSGKRADYVAKLLSSLSLFEFVAENNFFGIEGLNEDSVNFSLFQVVMNHTEMVKFLGIKDSQDPKLPGIVKRHVREFAEWAFKQRPDGTTVLGESRNMKFLAKVVKNRTALEALRSGRTLEEAVILTGEPDDIFASDINKARNYMVAAQGKQHQVKRASAGTRSSLDEVLKSAKLLQKFVGDLKDNDA